MARFMVTFMSSGGLTVEAENEDEAREIFERQRSYMAWAELKANGIDITDIQEESK